jgi:hypothetical protein
MPYIRRDTQGRLASLHRQAEAGATEFLPDDDAEVLAFVGRGTEQAAKDGFSQLDADFVRVLEDVIDVLIAKRVINLTDLPSEAQDKLFQRRSHRHETSLSRLNLLGDEISTPGYVEPDGAALLR